jgi:hypothetical protein
MVAHQFGTSFVPREEKLPTDGRFAWGKRVFSWAHAVHVKHHIKIL